jgi:uncharacterized protein (TIGR03435 family)
MNAATFCRPSRQSKPFHRTNNPARISSTPSRLYASQLGALFFFFMRATQHQFPFLFFAAAMLFATPSLNAQNSSPKPSATTSTPTGWEAAAGGKMSFGSVSIKQNNSGRGLALRSNVDLGKPDDSAPPGGLFSATNGPLVSYIGFAYKLTPAETAAVTSQLPRWASLNRYDIEGHAAGNPTKDQYRLMMQSYLADRFELRLHHQTVQIPVYNLVVAKPGTLGPKMRAYKQDPMCLYRQGPVAAPNVPSIGELPLNCGVLVTMPASRSNRIKEGARDSSMTTIAQDLLLMMDGLDRPVIDRTELAGTYDFTIEWTPDAASVTGAQTDPLNSSIERALQDQLGLKLESATGSVDRVVVDHIEQPPTN